MAIYWFEYTDDTSSLKFKSVDDLKYSTNDSNVKYLCAEGDDIDPLYLYAKLTYPVCIINYNKNIQWASNYFRTIKTVCFTNCRIKELLISEQKLDFFRLEGCKIESLQITSTIINQTIEFEDESEIVNFRSSHNIFRNFIIKKSKLSLIECHHFETGIFKIENVEISRAFFLLSSIGDLRIDDSDDFVSIYFTDCKIGRLQIVECQKLDISYSNCVFNDSIGVLVSSGKILFEQLQINNSSKIQFDLIENFNSEITISKSQFSNEVSFIGQNYKADKNIILRDCVFRELVIFGENNSLGLVIDKVLFQKGIYIPINTKDLNTKSVINTHSSVWCTLKNQAITRNDKISALELSRYEMESYTAELKNKKNKWQERIVLGLNNTSNRHGLSWGRGVYFTLKCWLAFFILFYMACDNFNGLNWSNSELVFFKKDFWDKAFQFLWLPQGVTMLSDGFKNNVNAVSFVLIVVSFFFGKIFIGYGIFQTISAFRKHGTSK